MSDQGFGGHAARIPGLDDIVVVPPREAEAEPAPEPPSEAGGLSERELDILDFERQWWKHAGAKERAVRDRFCCSPTRYYQALNALLDRPEALAHDPVLVGRLRRLREARQEARSAVRRQHA